MVSPNFHRINTHILMYWCIRCNCHLIFCIFWVFSYIIDDHWCLKCCSTTKLSQIVCLINSLGRALYFWNAKFCLNHQAFWVFIKSRLLFFSIFRPYFLPFSVLSVCLDLRKRFLITLFWCRRSNQNYSWMLNAVKKKPHLLNECTIRLL